MAVRFYRDKNGNNVCEVTIHICSKINRSIRAQPSRKVFLKPGENKNHIAAKLEKDLRRQAIEEVARKEGATNSFGSLFSEWEDALERKYGFSKQVTAETANDYCQAIRLYCQDIFNMPVDQVCRGDIRKIIDHMDSIGRSNSRKRAIINAINNMYNWAIDNGRLRGINASPATGIDVPRIRKSSPAILTPQQVREFLKVAREQCSEWFPIWLAAMLTGMRSGELWALRKRDVDLEGRLITVDKSYSRRRKTIKETKSGNWRKVPINEVEQIIVISFSRFARSTSHLLKGLKIFKERNTRFISITESIDTNSPLGVALYTILGALAQLEREMICERVRAGMANAKAKGKRIGRVKKRNSVLIRSLLEAKLSYREIARIAKCSHVSVHAELVAYKKEKAAAEKTKMEELQNSVVLPELSGQPIEELKKLNLSEETVRKVEQDLETAAKNKVAEVQGQYYETYD
jgi:integrase